MSQEVITIRTRKTSANCEICGKEDKAEKLLICGSAWSFLYADYRPIVNKVVTQYLTYLSTLCADVLAAALIEHSPRERKVKPT